VIHSATELDASGFGSAVPNGLSGSLRQVLAAANNVKAAAPAKIAGWSQNKC
jgi:hypothetical protein